MEGLAGLDYRRLRSQSRALDLALESTIKRRIYQAMKARGLATSVHFKASITAHPGDAGPSKLNCGSSGVLPEPVEYGLADHLKGFFSWLAQVATYSTDRHLYLVTRAQLHPPTSRRRPGQRRNNSFCAISVLNRREFMNHRY